MSDTIIMYENGKAIGGEGHPISGGGHAIQDNFGTDMPQEENLQFVGLKVTDDSTNGKTIVDATDKVTWEANGFLGAKNIMPYPYTRMSTVVRGITWGDNGDGGIVANGTGTEASSQPYCELYGAETNNTKSLLLKANTWYALTCKRTSPYALGANIYFLNPTTMLKTIYTYDAIWGNTSQTQVTAHNVYMFYNNVVYDEVKFRLPEDVYAQVEVRYRKGTDVTVVNDVQYPMLRLAEDTDDTYQPYAKTNKQLTKDKADKTIIASVESTDTASKTYTTGKQFIRSDGKLYKATTTINSGGTIIVGTNCELSDDITTQIDLNSVYKKFKFQNIEDVYYEYTNSDWRVNIIMNLGSVYRALLTLSNADMKYAVSVDSGTNWTILWNGNISRGSVSVTADGSKSYKTLLSELSALIDGTKITHNTALKIGNFTYRLLYEQGSSYLFSFVYADATSARVQSVNVAGSNSTLYLSVNNSITNMTNNAASNGTKFTLYY